MCQSLHVAIRPNKCINWCFVHLYLRFYYVLFLLVVNYNLSVFHGHEDTESYIFCCNDLVLLGSRDLISHVTIGLNIRGFLLVVYCNHVTNLHS